MLKLLYHCFRPFHVFQQWLRGRFTLSGLLTLGLLTFSAGLGFDTNQTTAYQAFTLAAALLATALAWSLAFRGRFAVSRELPRFGTAGEPLTYRLLLRNLDSRAHEGLLAADRMADPRPSFDEFASLPEPGEDQRNWVDRKVLFYRWSWLVKRNRGAAIPEVAVAALEPLGVTELRVTVLPERRGLLRFAETVVGRPDPLGLFKGLIRVPAPDTVAILPRRYPLAPIDLPGSRRHQPGGVALASVIGDSQEFVSLREYRPGDPPRRVHWRSWPKTGKLMVREHQDEYFVRHALALDTFCEEGKRLEEAVSVAASFVCSTLTQESLLDLMFIGTEAYCLTAGRGLGQTDRLLEVLACVKATPRKPFGELHAAVAARGALLSGCVLVLTAFDEPRRELIGRLRAMGVPVLALVVTAPGDPLQEDLAWFHKLEAGRIAEGLARL